MKTAIHKILFACLLPVLLGTSCGTASKGHIFEITDTAFLLDGEEIILRSGELHFDRIPREYWRHRLQMAKAMGLNAVSIYLFWNKAEPYPDKFDTGNFEDMVSFVKMCQEEDLWVILRPGPYVCAEWDMGGLPWWLLKDENIGLRSRDPYFLERSQKYLDMVGRYLAPLQVTSGGPIIMVQVENEYGHFGSDTEYLGTIRDYIEGAGFDVPLFQCDYYTRFADRHDDLFCMVNFGTTEDPAVAFDSLRAVMPVGPMMVAEYYPGWLDHWGEPHGTVPAEDVVKNMAYFLEHGYSFNFYMLHGGTSFGLWAGANHSEEENGRYQPTTSSYDYDAPITEAGWDNPKYHLIRETIGRYLSEGEILAEIPARPQVMAIPEFELTESAPLGGNLRQIISEEYPQNMEAYDQGFGCIVYTTVLETGGSGKLIFDKVRDFVVVLLDGTPVATIDRRLRENSCALPSCASGTKLDIIVEAMGRINSDKYLPDRKGIMGKVLLESESGTKELRNWNICPVPYENDKAPDVLYSSGIEANTPSFYRGDFSVDTTHDTFLDMSSWGKGLVWVNGRCLGRYWNIGPTQTMYLPGPWLKTGRNEIVIFDMLGPEHAVVRGLREPILDMLK